MLKYFLILWALSNPEIFDRLHFRGPRAFRKKKNWDYRFAKSWNFDFMYNFKKTWLH